jgi:hypothetical protein
VRCVELVSVKPFYTQGVVDVVILRIRAAAAVGNEWHVTLLRLPPAQELKWTRINRDGGGSNSCRGGKDSRGRGGMEAMWWQRRAWVSYTGPNRCEPVAE